jgi:hypothetical protein
MFSKYFSDTSMPRKAVGSLLRKAQPKSKSKNKSADVVPESATPVVGETYNPKVAKETNDRLWQEMNERRASGLPIEGLTYVPETPSGRMVRTGQASERKDVLGNRINQRISNSGFRANTQQELNNIQQLIEEQARLADSIKPTQSYSERKETEKRIKQIEDLLSGISDDFTPSRKYRVVEKPSREYSASPAPKRSEIARFIAPRRMLQAQRTGQGTRSADMDGVSSFSFATVKPVESDSSVPSEKAYLPSIEEMRAEQTKLEQQLKAMQDEAEKFRSTDFASMDIDDDPFSEAERLSDRIDAMRGKINTVQRRIKDAESNPWYAQNLGTGKGRTLTVESQPYARVYRSPREQGLQEPPRQDVEVNIPTSKYTKPNVVKPEYISETLQKYNTHKSRINSIENEIDKLLEQDSPDVDKKVADLLSDRDLERGRLNTTLYLIDEIRQYKNRITDRKLRSQVEAVTEKPVTVKPVGTPMRRANTPVVPSGARPTQSARPAQNTQMTAQVRSASGVDTPSSREIPSVVRNEINTARRANASGSLSNLDQDFENWLNTLQFKPSTSTSMTGVSASGKPSGKPSKTPSTPVAEPRKRPSVTEVERDLKTKSYQSASYLSNRELGMLYLRPELRSAFFDRNPHLVSQFEAEVTAQPKGSRRDRMRAILSGAHTPVTRVPSSARPIVEPVRPRRQVQSVGVSSPSAPSTPPKYNIERTGDSMSDAYSRYFGEQVKRSPSTQSKKLSPQELYFQRLGRASSLRETPSTSTNETIQALNELINSTPEVDEKNVVSQAQSRKANKQKVLDIQDKLFLSRLLGASPQEFNQIRNEVYGRRGAGQNTRTTSGARQTTQSDPKYRTVNPNISSGVSSAEKPSTKPEVVRTSITVGPDNDVRIATSNADADAPILGPEPASKKPRPRVFNPRNARGKVVYNQTAQERARIKRSKPSDDSTLDRDSVKGIKRFNARNRNATAGAFEEIRPSSGAFTNMGDVKRTWEEQVVKPIKSMKDPRQGKLNAIVAAKEGVGNTIGVLGKTPVVRAVAAPVRAYRRLGKWGKILVGATIAAGGLKAYDTWAGTLPRAKKKDSGSSSENPYVMASEMNKRLSKKISKSAYSNSLIKSNKSIKKSSPAPHASKNVNQKQIGHFTSNGVRVSTKYF